MRDALASGVRHLLLAPYHVPPYLFARLPAIGHDGNGQSSEPCPKPGEFDAHAAIIADFIRDLRGKDHIAIEPPAFRTNRTTLMIACTRQMTLSEASSRYGPRLIRAVCNKCRLLPRNRWVAMLPPAPSCKHSRPMKPLGMNSEALARMTMTGCRRTVGQHHCRHRQRLLDDRILFGRARGTRRLLSRLGRSQRIPLRHEPLG